MNRATSQSVTFQWAPFSSAILTSTALQQATLTALILATCLSVNAFADTKKEFRFAVGQRANVSVDTQYGAISVKPGPSGQVVVTATLKSDRVEVDEQQNGDRIDIASHLLNGAEQQMGQVDYEVFIPADATLNLHSSTGSMSVERLQGDLTFEGTDAVVNIRDVNHAHIVVQTMRGPVNLTDVHNAHIDVSTISGDMHLKSVTGPVVRADSSSGRIFYDGDFSSGGAYKFTTHNGDIEALVPANVSADFRAHSLLGHVQHDFPLQKRTHDRFASQQGSSFVGTSGKASSDVVLRSFSGKIRLKQR